MVKAPIKAIATTLMWSTNGNNTCKWCWIVSPLVRWWATYGGDEMHGWFERQPYPSHPATYLRKGYATS